MYYVGQVLYYELNIDYIVNTYCVNTDKPELKCNGKCHLAKQLQSVSNDTKNNDAISSLIEAFTFVYYNQYPTIVFTPDFLIDASEKSVFHSQNYTYKFSYSHFKPPIV
ncbi:hypothetical protein KO494_14615 [Lacinutrix sp. C3R15]|uniref:hypothetical protein n=1 Tax=Flavobacteriaceae TaxID=49546 RepID=UPI001C094E24|nr:MULTISPECIES: hypothetical protein [Flavobacteriaceae]MBU2940778.1 hypothetical protein [Lacinutrix sp. C3R15]MDO6624096.1 hypothetical protein [Oceanihabitans sp. 1_MG-2023]